MGVPPDKLLSILYKKEAAKKAKLEVEQGLREDAPPDEKSEEKAESEASPAMRENKSGLAHKEEEKKEGQPAKGNNLLAGAPKL